MKFITPHFTVRATIVEGQSHGWNTDSCVFTYPDTRSAFHKLAQPPKFLSKLELGPLHPSDLNTFHVKQLLERNRHTLTELSLNVKPADVMGICPRYDFEVDGVYQRLETLNIRGFLALGMASFSQLRCLKLHYCVPSFPVITLDKFLAAVGTWTSLEHFEIRNYLGVIHMVPPQPRPLISLARLRTLMIEDHPEWTAQLLNHLSVPPTAAVQLSAFLLTAPVDASPLYRLLPHQPTNPSYSTNPDVVNLPILNRIEGVTIELKDSLEIKGVQHITISGIARQGGSLTLNASWQVAEDCARAVRHTLFDSVIHHLCDLFRSDGTAAAMDVENSTEGAGSSSPTGMDEGCAGEEEAMDEGGLLDEDDVETMLFDEEQPTLFDKGQPTLIDKHWHPMRQVKCVGDYAGVSETSWRRMLLSYPWLCQLTVIDDIYDSDPQPLLRALCAADENTVVCNCLELLAIKGAPYSSSLVDAVENCTSLRYGSGRTQDSNALLELKLDLVFLSGMKLTKAVYAAQLAALRRSVVTSVEFRVRNFGTYCIDRACDED